MAYKDQYMLEQGVSSEGMLFMDMMHLPKRSLPAGPATVGQNGAACVVGLEKIRKESQRKRKRKRKRRNQSIGKLQSRYMHLKILKRELKVRITGCSHMPV